MRSPLILALAVLSLAPQIVEAAYENTTFGCAEGDASFSRKTGLRFEAVEDAGITAAIRKLPSKSVTGFAAQYGVRRITLLAQVTPSENVSFEPAEAQLYLEVESGAGTSKFYTLRLDAEDDRSVFEISPDDKDDISNLKVFPATPDKSLPLVILEIFAHFMGANSGSDTTTRYLIDLRQGAPRPVAALDCTEYQAGGACNAFDSMFGLRGKLTCDWVRERTDFLCTETRTTIWNWGLTGWKETFYLLSGDMVWPPEVVVPSSPQEWLAALRGRREIGAHTVLPRMGDTFVLWSDANLGLVLLASRGDSGHLWPKFKLAAIDYDAQGYSREVDVRTLELDELAQWEHVQRFDYGSPLEGVSPGVLVGSPMTFAVKPLRSDRGVFFQVALTQDNQHSLFWVGVDESAKPYRAQALLLATDASEYDACRRAHMLASAAHVNWTGRRVLATLDVEPRRSLNYEGGGYIPETDESDECPYDVELGWSYEKGWLVTPKVRECDEVTIRAISISDQGGIAARPAEICQDCR